LVIIIIIIIIIVIIITLLLVILLAIIMMLMLLVMFFKVNDGLDLPPVERLGACYAVVTVASDTTVVAVAVVATVLAAHTLTHTA